MQDRKEYLFFKFRESERGAESDLSREREK